MSCHNCHMCRVASYSLLMHWCALVSSLAFAFDGFLDDNEMWMGVTEYFIHAHILDRRTGKFLKVPADKSL